MLLLRRRDLGLQRDQLILHGRRFGVGPFSARRDCGGRLGRVLLSGCDLIRRPPPCSLIASAARASMSATDDCAAVILWPASASAASAAVPAFATRCSASTIFRSAATTCPPSSQRGGDLLGELLQVAQAPGEVLEL